MASVASTLKRDVSSFGVVRTAYMLVMKGINRCCLFSVLKVFKNEVADPDYLETNNSFRWQFLDARQMLDLAGDPHYPMSDADVRSALENGDECYAGFDGPTLACYGWYTSHAVTRMGVTTSCGADYIYQYGAFTHPSYRGLRLTASRGARARREYLARGYKGTIFSVETHNFHSMRAVCASPDIRPLGFYVAVKFGKFGWIYNSRSLRRRGVHSEFRRPTAELAPATS